MRFLRISLAAGLFNWGFIGPAFGSVSPQLLYAIAKVESNFNSAAVGDGGKAVGMYQLHKNYVDDVNMILKRKEFTYEDRLNPEKSRKMVEIYLNYYGKGLSDMDKARIHNGGPKGHKKRATLAYAKKIQKHLNRKEHK